MAGVSAAGLIPLRNYAPISHVGHLSPWLLAVVFAAGMLLLVDVPSRRELDTITLSEIPLVVALFFLTPVATVLAFVVGAGAALGIVLRQRGLKLVFNVAMFALQAVIAVLLFHAVVGHSRGRDPRAWAAAMLAALVANLLSGVGVAFVVWLHSRVFQADVTSWVLLNEAVAVIAKTAIALLVVVVVEQGADNAVALLVIVAAVMYAAFRAYALLYIRHQRVENLYRFTRAIAGTVDPSEIADRALSEARDLLQAHGAELVLTGASRLVVRVGESSDAESELALATSSEMLEYLRDASGARRFEAGSDSTTDDWLAPRGWHTALVVQLGGETSFGWIAVARDVDDEPFSDADEQLFEALANHLSVALENGRLLDELSAEVRERERRALHDPLTDLPNREHFTDAVANAIARDGDAHVAVLLVALDDFREINETLGHAHGDEVLRDVAERMGELAPGVSMAARLGGDEFALLLPDARGVGAAARIAETIVRAFEEHPFHVAGLVIEIGVRVGVAVFPEHGGSAPQLLRRAEIALRAAKHRHTRVGTFVSADDPDAPHQLVLAHQLRRALEHDELTVYVQPKLALAAGAEAVIGVEVLVRWLKPDGTVAPPDEFIPVAERTGLIRPLTNFVLARALEHRRQWTAAGYDLNVAVNVSVRDLVDPAFPEQVAVELTRAVCPASALTLEITETQIMLEPERVAAALRRLRVLGVKVSIDDFGTGYSSLSSVRALVVDELKIDKSFVFGAADDEQDGTLVKSITELGHGLGMRVVAEGVEDERTLALLRALGVDVAQGYGIARPMPAVDLPGWLAAIDEYTLDAR
jgi:diguanylate cyclase (GGDEF)-like protein